MDTTSSRSRMSPELARFCRDALAKREKGANDVVMLLDVASTAGTFTRRVPTEGSVLKFLDGKRKSLGNDALRLLAPLFCGTDEGDRREYRRLVDELRDDSISAAKIDKQRTYHYFSVPYPPLSGLPSSTSGADSRFFIERLLIQMGQLAFLNWDVHPDVATKVSDGEFDMNDRVEALRSGRAHVLVNLVSLPRLRLLRFITTPVSISLNGVVLNDASGVDNVVDVAAKFLSGSTEASKPSRLPFTALVIKGEVGSLHVSWMNGRRATADQLRPEVESTLNHQELAGRLRASDGEAAPLVLFCDELTALGVLRALDGRGRLLFPLNSDSSIARDHRRRSLPTHQLGIGYHIKSKHSEEMERVAGLFRRFLESEREVVTALYIDLYRQFTQHVRTCLEQSPYLYVGGVRRVGREIVSEAYLPELVAENARSHVRRCLQLSRRTIELHRPDDPWTPILSRARERLQTLEARDRPAVRASLMTALSMAAGLDPCKQKVSTRKHLDVALKNRAQLRLLLERDLDVDLPNEDDFFDRLTAQPRAAGIERFVSVLQEVLEDSANTTQVTVILDRNKVAESVRAEVDSQFHAWRQEAESDGQGARLVLIDKGKSSMKIALALGEPVGAIWLRPNGRSLDLLFLWVAKHMQSGNNIGPLLVRKSIEAAAHSNTYDTVSFDITGMPKWLVSWFVNLGFKESKPGRYSYVLECMNMARRAPKRRKTPKRR